MEAGISKLWVCNAHSEENPTMKVFGLEGNVYRLARLAGRPVPEVALARFELVRRVDGLRAKGLTVAVAIAAVGLSRAGYYRWRRQARGGVERLAPRSRRPTIGGCSTTIRPGDSVSRRPTRCRRGGS